MLFKTFLFISASLPRSQKWGVVVSYVKR